MQQHTTAFVDDDFCFACGQKNPLGLALSFEVRDDGTCATEFTPSHHHQGFSGVFHGGLIATIADDLMNNHLFRAFGVYAATAELSVRFRKPAPVGVRLVFTSKKDGERSGIHEMSCEVRSKEDNTLLALAKGRFVKVEIPVEIAQGKNLRHPEV